MGNNIGKAGKCAAEYQEFVREVQEELPKFLDLGGDVRFNDCAELKTDGFAIVAQTQYGKGNKHTMVLAMTEEFASIYQVSTKRKEITGVTRDADLMPPRALSIKKFEQAKQLILNRMGISGSEIYPPLIDIPAGPAIPASPSTDFNRASNR